MRNFVKSKLFPLLAAFAVSLFAIYVLTPSPPTAPSTVIVSRTEIDDREPLGVVIDAQSSTPPVGPQIVQTAEVNFPTVGKVIVQSIEEDGQFPKMSFISKETGKVLLSSTIIDSDKYLKHDVGSPDSFPQLRFRTVKQRAAAGPVIMAVGIYHGGSDNGYYATLFTERRGKLVRLNERTFNTAVQGGFYFGPLNKKLGEGLVVWSFIWGDGLWESHYTSHHYRVEIYKIVGDRLVLSRHYKTKRMYQPEENADSLGELGIRGADQRKGIPEINETIDLE